MFRSTFIAAAFALTACASPSTATSAGEVRDCFRSMDVHGFSIVDDHRVKLRINAQRQYIFTIRRDTDDLDWANSISVRSPTNFVCVGQPNGVQLVGGNPETYYIVTAIERAPPPPEPAEPEGS
ncbi:MAG: DUF6491 family protein [Caulobacteraceae bacterium]